MSRRKRLVIWALALTASVVFVVLSNRPLVRMLVYGEPLIHVYNYVNEDGTFAEMEIPEKGRDLAMIESLYARQLDETGSPRTPLYRTFAIQPWRFWMWFDYASHPRWRYPYRAAERAN